MVNYDEKYVIVCIRNDGRNTETVLDVGTGKEILMDNVLFKDKGIAEDVLANLPPNGHEYNVVPIRYNDPIHNPKYYPSKVSRNYTHDIIGDKTEIMKMVCKCFDEKQTSVREGLDKQFIFEYIMHNGKGHFNPRLVKDVIDFL